MQLEYTIEEGDRDAFLEYHSEHSATLQVLRRQHLYGYAILLAIFGAIYWLLGGTALVIAFLTLGPLWAAWWPMRTRKIARAQAEAFYQDHAGGLRVGAHTLTLDAGGLMESDGTGERRKPLSAVRPVVHLPDYVNIYVGPIQAVVIPRRRIVKGDLAAFVAELERMMAGRPT